MIYNNEYFIVKVSELRVIASKAKQSVACIKIKLSDCSHKEHQYGRNVQPIITNEVIIIAVVAKQLVKS